MMGMGLNGEQIAAMSAQLNFQDFQDVVYSMYGLNAGGMKGIQALGIFTDGYIHKGENFFNWAQSLLEHVTGDPTITFAEYEELRKQHPALKELVFKGFSYTAEKKDETKEFTFSAEDTPNVLLIDALRASMSFPTAFKPWDVRQKDPKTKEISVIGTFADGGIGNNFPIDEFNKKRFQDENYPLQETAHKRSRILVMRNPCSVGLSLCSLEKLDPEITPFTDRIIDLRSKQTATTQSSEKTTEEPMTPRKATLGDLFHGIRVATLGQMIKNEDMEMKYDVYKGQVVQVYPEEVGTLEFNLSPTKQKNITESGYQAWLKWEEKFRDPSLIYPEERAPELIIPRGKEKEALLKLFIENFAGLLKEAEAKRHHPNPAFRDISINQRMKFHSFMIQEGIRKCKEFGLPFEELLAIAHKQVIEQHQERKKDKQELKKHLDTFINPASKTKILLSLMKSTKKADHLKALRLFCGSMSNAIDLVARSRGKILAAAAQSGNAELLNGMLTHLRDNWNMMYQQGRKPSYTLEGVINDSSRESLYKYALESENYRDVVDVLLAGGVDPLRLDKDGKNAFHYALDQLNQGKVDTGILEFLINKVESTQDISLSAMNFGPHGDTLGHYIIKHANADALKRLKNNPELLKKLISPYASNYDDVNCQELAAHHSQVLLGESSPKSMFESIIVSDPHSLESTSGPSTLEDQDNEEMMRLRNECAMVYEAKKPQSREEWKEYITTHAPGYQQAKTEALKLKEALRNAITSNNEKDLERMIKSMSAEQCLLLLGATNILHPKNEQKLSFIFECAISHDPTQQATAAKAVELLCKKIYDNGRKFPQAYKGMLDLLQTKHEQQSPLYLAALANNVPLIQVLRSYDVSVNHAGPLDCPSALTAAAKAGSCEAVSAIIASKPNLGFASTFRTIERSKALDINGKSLFHHLASCTGNPKQVAEAFYNALYTGSGTVRVVTIAGYLQSYTGITDNAGHSCFRYLLQNPNAKEILAGLVIKGKGYTTANSWYLDTYFDFTTKRNDGYTDLEWAYKSNPELAAFIAKNMYYPDVAEKAKKLIDKESEIALEDEFTFIEEEEVTLSKKPVTPRYSSKRNEEKGSTSAPIDEKDKSNKKGTDQKPF